MCVLNTQRDKTEVKDTEFWCLSILLNIQLFLIILPLCLKTLYLTLFSDIKWQNVEQYPDSSTLPSCFSEACHCPITFLLHVFASQHHHYFSWTHHFGFTENKIKKTQLSFEYLLCSLLPISTLFLAPSVCFFALLLLQNLCILFLLSFSLYLSHQGLDTKPKVLFIACCTLRVSAVCSSWSLSLSAATRTRCNSLSHAD